MPWMLIAASLLLAYLLGALPTGYLATRIARGIDIRTVGSGHTGGSNVLRAAGPLAAVATLLADAGKGFAAVMVARALVPDLALVHALSGLVAVTGHNWPVFLRFRGGVGSMTTVGAALALAAWPVVAAGALALAVVAVWRYTSLGSLTLAAALPLAFLAGGLQRAWPMEYILLAIGTSALSAWALRANIVRLRLGTERKLGQTIRPGRSDIAP